MLKKVLCYEVDNILSLVRSLKEVDLTGYDFSKIESWHQLYLLDFSEIVSHISGVPNTDLVQPLEKVYESYLKIVDKTFWQSWLEERRNYPHRYPKYEPTSDKSQNFPAFYVLMKSYECVLIHKTAMQSLFIKLEQDGEVNDEILHKVLQVDKTIIFYPPVQNKINHAIVTQDANFLKNLTRSLNSTMPVRRYPELIFAVWLVVQSGYYDELTKEQKVSFFMNYYSEYKEPESLFREVNRIKKSLKT